MQNWVRWLDPLLNPQACLPPLPEQEQPTENADALLRRLDLLLRRNIRVALTGERRSRLKGQGLDFHGLREYTPGDDIRKMDWSVFARTLSPHVREYQEEKQLIVWLVIDLTPSMGFGRLRSKERLAVELAGLICLMAQKAHYKFGALLIGQEHSWVIPPKTGPAQAQFLMQTLLQAVEKDMQTNNLEKAQSTEGNIPDALTEACRKLEHLVQKQSVIFFLSDFLVAECSDSVTESQSPSWQKSLGELSRRAQLFCLLLADPVEAKLPEGLGLLTLTDPETGTLFQVDTNDAALLTQANQVARQHQENCLAILRQMGIAIVALTENDAVQTLLNLLTGQEKR
jgi:uncharacterized protein (DUF58 family)